MNEKEEKRAINQRDSRNLNKYGDRIKWVRSKLGLTLSQVSEHTGIPVSSLNGRENGVRTYNIEEFLILARYFNSSWLSHFECKDTPEINNIKINRIGLMWLMFGISE